MRGSSMARRLCARTVLFIAACFVVVGSPKSLRAQDPFEIRVEQYEEPTFGGFTFEQHVNFIQM